MNITIKPYFKSFFAVQALIIFNSSIHQDSKMMNFINPNYSLNVHIIGFELSS